MSLANTSMAPVVIFWKTSHSLLISLQDARDLQKLAFSWVTFTNDIKNEKYFESQKY